MQHLQTSVHCPPNCSLIFYSSLGIAGCFHYGLSHVRSTACVSKCHLRTPTTTFSFYFTSPLFCPWSSPLSPNILCARTTCISSMQKWKLRLWGCTLSLKCRTLRPEYQSLVFDACLLDSSRACCCCRLKFDRALWEQLFSLRGYAYLALVHHHFCQHSLLCKRALIFTGAFPSLSAVLNHILTSALGVVLQCAAYDCGAT